MSWILYSTMTRDGDIERRSGRYENIDVLDQELSRHGEMMVNFFELPDAVYHLRQWAFGRMRQLEVAEFCSMLSMYVSGGVDLQSALADMERSARTLAFKHVVTELRRSLMNGYPLSQALKATGQFPEEVLALARIGEESGTLDQVLRDAGTHIERVAAIKSAAKRAMIYPAFTLFVIVGGALFWLSYVIPKIATVFKSINLKLPASTMALVAASDWVREYWWVLVILFVGTPILFFAARRNEKFRYETDRLAWHLPIFGRIVSGSEMAFYFQYLGLMYGAGVVITQALDTLTRAVKNRYLRARVLGVIERLRGGEPLVVAIERTEIFEPLAVRMIGIGEETGRLESQLKKLGDIYFARVNALVEVLAKVIEPALLIVMAILFGFFIIAVIGPIYETIGKLGGGGS
jgi:type II secretory pathway component PulF